MRELRRDRPEVMLCFGWASPICRTGIVVARSTGTPLLFLGDSNWQAAATGRHPRLRSLALGTLFRGAAGALSTGTFNREFYIGHGMAPNRVLPGVYPTDVDAFRSAAERRTQARPSEAARRPLVIGFAGKLTPIKAAEDLIWATAHLPPEPPWELWLVGDGPLRRHLESLVHERGLTGRVRFLGFRNTDELPALVSAMDVLVMPSRKEPRGLVAIEAMASGVATIVSSATGLWGPGDVVQNGETGLVYPAGDVPALATCLRRLLRDAGLRDRLARSGQARAMSFGPRQFADTTAAALVTTARERARAVPR